MRKLLSLKHNDTLAPLVRIALPVMLANGVETLYNLTDTWFLGRLGPREVAAPSISFNLVMLIILVGTGLAGAGTTLIARAAGRKDREKVDFYLGQMASFLLLSSLVMGGAGFLLTDPFLRVIQTPADIFPLTRVYLRTVCLGVPFMYCFFILQGAMQGTGNTMVALRVQLLATAVNIPLDALLIFGAGPVPCLGVQGAAAATVISRVVAAAAGMIILIRGNHGMVLTRKNMVFQRDALRLFLKLGLPSSLSQAGSSLGFTVLHGIVNSFGTAVIAAFGVVGKIHSLFYMPAQGLARATTTLVGQSLGADDPDRARRSVRTGILLGLLYIIPGMMLTWFQGAHFIRFFVDDPQVIMEGTLIFRIISPSVIIFVMFMVYGGAFQGAGDARSLMVLHLGRLWVFRLPLAWLFALHLGWGPRGMWYAMLISNVAITAAGYLRFRRGRWVHALQGE